MRTRTRTPLSTQDGLASALTGLPSRLAAVPAGGFLVVGLPLVLPVQKAFHLGRRHLLGSGRQGGGTLGREGSLGFAVGGGGGDGAGLFGTRPLFCGAIDHVACVHRVCHLGTAERLFS